MYEGNILVPFYIHKDEYKNLRKIKKKIRKNSKIYTDYVLKDRNGSEVKNLYNCTIQPKYLTMDREELLFKVKDNIIIYVEKYKELTIIMNKMTLAYKFDKDISDFYIVLAKKLRIFVQHNTELAYYVFDDENFSLKEIARCNCKILDAIYISDTNEIACVISERKALNVYTMSESVFYLGNIIANFKRSKCDMQNKKRLFYVDNDLYFYQNNRLVNIANRKNSLRGGEIYQIKNMLLTIEKENGKTITSSYEIPTGEFIFTQELVGIFDVRCFKNKIIFFNTFCIMFFTFLDDRLFLIKEIKNIDINYDIVMTDILFYERRIEILFVCEYMNIFDSEYPSDYRNAFYYESSDSISLNEIKSVQVQDQSPNNESVIRSRDENDLNNTNQEFDSNDSFPYFHKSEQTDFNKILSEDNKNMDINKQVIDDEKDSTEVDNENFVINITNMDEEENISYSTNESVLEESSTDYKNISDGQEYIDFENILSAKENNRFLSNDFILYLKETEANEKKNKSNFVGDCNNQLMLHGFTPYVWEIIENVEERLESPKFRICLKSVYKRIEKIFNKMNVFSTCYKNTCPETNINIDTKLTELLEKISSHLFFNYDDISNQKFEQTIKSISLDIHEFIDDHLDEIKLLYDGSSNDLQCILKSSNTEAYRYLQYFIYLLIYCDYPLMEDDRKEMVVPFLQSLIIGYSQVAYTFDFIETISKDIVVEMMDNKGFNEAAYLALNFDDDLFVFFMEKCSMSKLIDGSGYLQLALLEKAYSLCLKERRCFTKVNNFFAKIFFTISLKNLNRFEIDRFIIFTEKIELIYLDEELEIPMLDVYNSQKKYAKVLQTIYVLDESE